MSQNSVYFLVTKTEKNQYYILFYKYIINLFFNNYNKKWLSTKVYTQIMSKKAINMSHFCNDYATIIIQCVICDCKWDFNKYVN